MQVTATEFKMNFGKYLEMVVTEDIYITRNGKTVAKMINPNVSSVDLISGILAGKVPSDIDRHTILCEEHKCQGLVSASAITDIFYITRKALGNIEETYRVLGNILNIVKVLTVTNTDVLNAFQTKAKDFEDCLMATCAKSNKCDCIVTRNKKDFMDFGIILCSPEEIIEKFTH